MQLHGSAHWLQRGIALTRPPGNISPAVCDIQTEPAEPTDMINGHPPARDYTNADLTLKQRDDIALDPNLVNNDESN
jgi:hypothetical protein